jgi:hypothetical protein
VAAGDRREVTRTLHLDGAVGAEVGLVHVVDALGSVDVHV